MAYLRNISSNPFSNLNNNHISVISSQKKENLLKYKFENNKGYVIGISKLDNTTKDRNKIPNKSIKSKRTPYDFIENNFKSKKNEKKNFVFKEINNTNNYNYNYANNYKNNYNFEINKKNNEILKKEKNDNLYNNYINLNNDNDKKYKKRPISKYNCFINNHKNEYIVPEYNNNGNINCNNQGINYNNKRNEQENLKDSESKKLPERLKTINRINYEDQQKKNNKEKEKNQVGQIIKPFKDKNEVNNIKEVSGNVFNQIENKKDGIRRYYKLKNTSKIVEDEKNEKNNHDIKKNEKPKDFTNKNNNFLKTTYTKINKYGDNRKIESKQNHDFDINKSKYVGNIIESKNINFKIINKNINFYIVRNNKIMLSQKNEIPKKITKKKEIDFTIKENGKHKTLNNPKIIKQEIELSVIDAINNKNKLIFNDKKQNEFNNLKESIQKNSQENFIKNKNNIIIEQKDFERKKITKEQFVKKPNKIYGFINNGNNCYLNSSLQLLTRINDLKEKILNFNEINKDNITNGQLTKEFKNILNRIENEENEKLIISPDNLKRIMANIDEKYRRNHQEDANEFISMFLNALVSETSNKNRPIDKIEVYDKKDQDAFNKFYKKFYNKMGYSFILELLYGIIKTEKICKNCGERNFIKFSSFNMLDLPIYNLAKSKKILDLKEILYNYLSEYKNNGFTCIQCDQNDVYTNTTIYTLPKYLIIFFGRIVEKEYLYNEIKYPEKFNFNEYTNNAIKIKKNYNYKLECVIEHSGGAYSGHYTCLCRISDNCWYDFSDSYGGKHSQGHVSKNAIILLYQAQ